MIRFARWIVVVAVLPLLAPAARAVTMDGVLDAEYGDAIVVQSIQTSSGGGGQISGDSNVGDLDFANGSELDLAYAFVSDSALHLFLGGNLALMLNANQNGTVRHVLDVFLDTRAGGQQTLDGIAGPHVLNGLGFDLGFEADFGFELEGDDNGFNGPREWYARRIELPNGFGGAFTFLGVTSAGGPGNLIGGINPHGVRVTIDNRNVAGVTAGCSASSGAGVTRGVEWQIPLAAIGNPPGCIRITAFIRNGGSLGSQVLAPAPLGSCPLGAASTLDFSTITDDQFFTVCNTTAVPGNGRAGLALALLGPNPSRGERLRVAFTLPDDAPARLQLVDGAGRVLRERTVGGAGKAFVEDLSEGPRIGPGVYWIRLAQGRFGVTRKFAVVR